MKKSIVYLALPLVLFGFLAVRIPNVQAQPTTFSIESIGEQLGLGESDLKQAVINAIKWALAFMVLVAVVLIIYGGFVWMTAAGSEENVGKAKKIISAAVIGLVVILLAWAIVSFVTRTASNLTVNEDGG